MGAYHQEEIEAGARLDNLEQVSLLVTLATFYFGYFLNAETIAVGAKYVAAGGACCACCLMVLTTSVASGMC